MGLLFAGVGTYWFAPFHIAYPTGSLATALTSDFYDFCSAVATYREKDFTHFTLDRSYSAAWLPTFFARKVGIIDGFAWASICSLGLLGTGLYTWARALHSRWAGVFTVFFALTIAPLVVLGRTLTFYPEYVAIFTLSAGLVCLAIRFRGLINLAAAGLSIGACLLIDVRGVVWAVPGLGMLCLVYLPQHWRKSLPAALVLFFTLGLSWWAGPSSYPANHTALDDQANPVRLYNDVQRKALSRTQKVHKKIQRIAPDTWKISNTTDAQGRPVIQVQSVGETSGEPLSIDDIRTPLEKAGMIEKEGVFVEVSPEVGTVFVRLAFTAKSVLREPTPQEIPSFIWGRTPIHQIPKTLWMLASDTGQVSPLLADTASIKEGREAHFHPFYPLAIACAGLILWGLRGRKMVLLAFLATAAPFLVVLYSASNLEFRNRFASSALPPFAVLFGVGLALLWRAPSEQAGQRTRPFKNIGFSSIWPAAVRMVLLAALVLGFIPNHLAPNAPWRKPLLADHEVQAMERAAQQAGPIPGAKGSEWCVEGLQQDILEGRSALGEMYF